MRVFRQSLVQRGFWGSQRGFLSYWVWGWWLPRGFVTTTRVFVAAGVLPPAVFLVAERRRGGFATSRFFVRSRFFRRSRDFVTFATLTTDDGDDEPYASVRAISPSPFGRHIGVRSRSRVVDFSSRRRERGVFARRRRAHDSRDDAHASEASDVGQAAPSGHDHHRRIDTSHVRIFR